MRLSPLFAALIVGCSASGPEADFPRDTDDTRGGDAVGEGEGEGAPAADAPPDTAGVAQGAPTEPPPAPTPPFEPRITDWSCPDGWAPSPSLRAGVAAPEVPERLAAHLHCRPPDPPAEACPPGRIRRLGESECVPHGVECPPVGVDWADEERLRARAEGFEGEIRYVLPRRRTGVGARDDPHGSIGEAVEAAEPGDILALAPGQYLENVDTAGRVAILGACVADTAIVAPEAQVEEVPRATIEIRDSGGSLVADLTVSGSAAGMGVRGSDGDVTLRAIRFDRTAFLALNVAEGPGWVTGEELSFIGTTPVQGLWGRGAFAVREGKLRLLRPSFHDNRFSAMGVHQPLSTIEVEDAIVTATGSHPEADEGGFSGLITAGGRFTLRRAWLDGNQSAEFAASSVGAIPGEPTLLDVADVIARNTRLGTGPFIGSVFQVADGSELVARRIMAEGTGGSLVFASHRGTDLQIEDVVVRDRQGVSSGVSLAVGARAEVRRMIIAGARGCWGEAAGPVLAEAPRDQGPPHLLVEDLLVTGGRAIFGAHILHGAHMTARRGLLAGNGHHLAAIRTQSPETTVELEDVRIVDIEPRPMAELADDDRVGPRVDDVAISGLGVWVTHGAALSAKRLVVERVTTFGVVVSAGGASADLEDALVAEVAPHAREPARGAHGVHAQVDARIEGRRLHVRDLEGSASSSRASTPDNTTWAAPPSWSFTTSGWRASDRSPRPRAWMRGSAASG